MQLTLYLSDGHSLKEKRGVLRKIKSRVRDEFNVSIAECDGHDLWQKAVLGICQVGTDQGYVDGTLRQVISFIENLYVAQVGEEKVEFLHYK